MIERISNEQLMNVAGGISGCRLGMTAAGAVAGAAVGLTGGAAPGTVRQIITANTVAATGISNLVYDAQKQSGLGLIDLPAAVSGFVPNNLIPGVAIVGGAWTGGRAGWHAADSRCAR